MALYQTNTHWSDSSLGLPMRTVPSSDTWTTLNLSNPVILTSTSLDRLSFTNLAPSFPPGHAPPLFTLVDSWEEHGMISGKGRETPCDKQRSVITTPTIPRMKVILEEKIVVEAWTAHVQPQAPPNHIPWHGLGYLRSVEETSEKSSVPTNHTTTNVLGDSQRLSNLPDTYFKYKTSRRNGLILEHEIRRGVQKDMNGADTGTTEGTLATNDIQALERLENVGHAQNETAGCHRRSFYPVAAKKHLNLAFRRGHKAFPSLKLHDVAPNKRRDSTSFDSIPTPFRGSPTTYSPAVQPVHYSTCQGLGLTEMLESLREKCTSFSSRNALLTDWFYRPQSRCKENAALTETTTSRPKSDVDEWVFAEPLMGMVETLATQANYSGVHSILLKDNDSSAPPHSPSDYTHLRSLTPLATMHNQIGNWAPPTAPLRSCLARSPLTGSAQFRPHFRKAKKTVRFADHPIFTPCKPTVDMPALDNYPGKLLVSIPPTIALPAPPKYQSVVLTAWMPPPPISVVRSPRSARPSRNSWTNSLLNRSLRSPPPPPRRPLSHRYPTSPKLPLFSEGSPLARTLSGSSLRQSYTYKPPPDIVGKSPPARRAHSGSVRPFRKRSLAQDKKPYVGKDDLNISHPMPITAISLTKRNPGGTLGGNGDNSANTKNNTVASPLRSIFMKLK